MMAQNVAPAKTKAPAIISGSRQDDGSRPISGSRQDQCFLFGFVFYTLQPNTITQPEFDVAIPSDKTRRKSIVSRLRLKSVVYDTSPPKGTAVGCFEGAFLKGSLPLYVQGPRHRGRRGVVRHHVDDRRAEHGPGPIGVRPYAHGAASPQLLQTGTTRERRFDVDPALQVIST